VAQTTGTRSLAIRSGCADPTILGHRQVAESELGRAGLVGQTGEMRTPRDPIYARLTRYTPDPVHHASQCYDVRGQAEALETPSDSCQASSTIAARTTPAGVDRLPHGLALLCGSSTPSLPTQGRQCLPKIYSISRDLPDPQVCIGLKLQRGHPEMLNS
jgi:hypothetical protein